MAKKSAGRKTKPKPGFIKVSLSLTVAAHRALNTYAVRDSEATASRLNFSETASRMMLHAEKALAGAETTFPQHAQ